jgi:hypothetical protein
MRIPALGCVLAATAVTAATAHAQSAQPYSLQASALFTTANVGSGGSGVAGAGVEGQLRYTSGLWSLGGGVQYSSHSSRNDVTDRDDNIKLTGVFVEPRRTFVVASPRVGPYLALRGALLRQSNNFGGSSSNGYAFGGGGGVIVALTDRVNLDGGAAVLRQSLGEFTIGAQEFRFGMLTSYVAKAGVSIGFGSPKPL